MIRPAPPAPIKTAFLTFLIAAIVALGVARGASADQSGHAAATDTPTPTVKPIHR